MTDIRKVLAFNMKHYRKILGLSQEKLAEKVNITVNHIALIETGKRFPTVPMLERIAEGLERDTVEMFLIKQDDPFNKKALKDKILADVEAILTARLDEIEK